MKSLIIAASKTANTVIKERAALDGHVKTAGDVTAHLWFVGQQPTDYDRVTEANERGVVDGQFVPEKAVSLTPSRTKTSSTTGIRYDESSGCTARRMS